MSSTLVTIRNRFSSNIMRTISVGDTRVDLAYADLSGADLSGADLINADLRYANLRHADLSGASLHCADLSRADLRHADLSRASLIRTKLGGANLYCTNLTGVDLTGVDLNNVIDLNGIDLRVADLSGIRADFRSVLTAAPNEVAGLLSKLESGRIDGSVYEGPCSCLVGTIATERGCNYQRLEGLLPNPYRPAERWFLAINPTCTPYNNQIAAITADWIREWQADNAVGG